jgi:bacteriocin-like protein
MSRIQISDLTISKDNSELQSLTNEELKSISGGISAAGFIKWALAFLNSFDNVRGHWSASSGGAGFLVGWNIK